MFGCSFKSRNLPVASTSAARSPRGATSTAAGTSRLCSPLARSAGSGRRPQRIQQAARDVVCLAPLTLEDHSAL
jgi:hypothetical protein